MKEPYFIDVPAKQYHADAASGRYLSSHNLAQFRACPLTYSLMMTGKLKRPESPALALGFKELPYSEMGLKTSRLRPSMPKEAEGLREHPEWLDVEDRPAAK